MVKRNLGPFWVEPFRHNEQDKQPRSANQAAYGDDLREVGRVQVVLPATVPALQDRRADQRNRDASPHRLRRRLPGSRSVQRPGSQLPTRRTVICGAYAPRNRHVPKTPTPDISVLSSC